MNINVNASCVNCLLFEQKEEPTLMMPFLQSFRHLLFLFFFFFNLRKENGAALFFIFAFRYFSLLSFYLAPSSLAY